MRRRRQAGRQEDDGRRCLGFRPQVPRRTQVCRRRTPPRLPARLISHIDLSRDDKAHRFVVTLNAFQDGNRLAYLALAIAIAIDSLVFMSGLFGANAVRSPLSDVPSLQGPFGEPVSKAIIENALLPDTYETARATRWLRCARSRRSDGFTKEVWMPEDGTANRACDGRSQCRCRYWRRETRFNGPSGAFPRAWRTVRIPVGDSAQGVRCRQGAASRFAYLERADRCGVAAQTPAGNVQRSCRTLLHPYERRTGASRLRCTVEG